MELYLNELNTLKDMGSMESYKDAQENFRNFLQMERVRQNLNQATTYDLISSHGNMEDLIFYATLTEGDDAMFAA